MRFSKTEKFFEFPQQNLSRVCFCNVDDISGTECRRCINKQVAMSLRTKNPLSRILYEHGERGINISFCV